MQEAAAAQAERLVVAGLKRLGWDEGMLKQRRWRQGGLGERDAPRNDAAAELDRGAFEHGQPGVSGLAFKPAKGEPPRQIEMTKPDINMTICLTDPFMAETLLHQPKKGGNQPPHQQGSAKGFESLA